MNGRHAWCSHVASCGLAQWHQALRGTSMAQVGARVMQQRRHRTELRRIREEGRSHPEVGGRRARLLHVEGHPHRDRHGPGVAGRRDGDAARLRARRQGAPASSSPNVPCAEFVFDEAVLHRQVGKPAVLRDQLVRPGNSVGIARQTDLSRPILRVAYEDNFTDECGLDAVRAGSGTALAPNEAGGFVGGSRVLHAHPLAFRWSFEGTDPAAELLPANSRKALARHDLPRLPFTAGVPARRSRARP